MGVNRSLCQKLDKVFSLYVRLSNTDDSGVGICVTCSRIKTIRDLDAGHFISRRYYPTRWDLKNVGVQCRSCNRFEQGRQFEYSTYINKKYGQGEADKLEFKAKSGKAPHNFEIEEMIKYYKEQVKKLKLEKCL